MTWYELTYPTKALPYYAISYITAETMEKANAAIRELLPAEAWPLVSIRQVPAQEYLEALSAHLQRYPESLEVDLNQLE